MSNASGYYLQQLKVMVVSDVHLKDAADFRYQLLLELGRDAVRQRVSCFVLLGDIFDFCFGATAYFRRKFEGLGARLSWMAKEGVRVIFVQGNHEFALKYLNWEGVEFVTKRELTLRIDDQTILHLTHGDRIAAPWHYHLYCALSRSFLFRWGGLMCPRKKLDEFCLKVSEQSRKRSQNKKLRQQAVLSSLHKWLGRCAVSAPGKGHIGVCGHFHIPWDVPVAVEASGRILCLKSWDYPNYLLFDQEGCIRYEYDFGRELFTRQSGGANWSFQQKGYDDEKSVFETPG